MMGSMAPQDDPGKLFVGGLHPTTSEDTLRDYFQGFGEVVDCKLMIDNVTRKSRGFGFVTFRDQRSAADVIEKVPHILDGKQIDPKKAVPKGPGQSIILKQMGLNSAAPGMARSRNRNPECKVFVGGISQQTTENELRAYFSEFGNVTDVAIPQDKTTGNIRGFAFVGFDNPETVQRLLRIHFHQINGRTVEVKSCDEQGTKNRGQMDMNGQFMGAPGGGYGQDASQSPYAQGAYGAYGSMMQHAQYAQGPGAAGYGTGYDMLTGSSASTAYPDPNAYGQAGSALSAYGAGYGALSAAATSQYGVASTTALAGQNPSAGAASTADYASYNPYGFGSYQQEASSYGPARSFASDLSAYASVGTATPAGYGTDTAVAAYGVAGSYSDSASAAFGRGAVPSGNQRGFHPYGR
eukprot:gene10174-11215_t